MLPPIAAVTTELWMITHKSLKDTARVRAVMDVVGERLKRELPRLVAADDPGASA